MFKDITLGQYFPGNSPIHRLDPRTKLTLMLVYIVMVFLVQDMWLFMGVAAYVAGVTCLAQVPLSYLWRSLKPLKWVLVFMFILNVLMIIPERPFGAGGGSPLPGAASGRLALSPSGWYCWWQAPP